MLHLQAKFMLMEAVLERKTKTSFRPTQQPIKHQNEMLTYEILQQHKREQQGLVFAGLMEKPTITDDIFTPEQERAFSKGRAVEEVFDDIEKRYGF